MSKQDLPPTPEPPLIHETKVALRKRQMFLIEIKPNLVHNEYPVISIFIKHERQKTPKTDTTD